MVTKVENKLLYNISWFITGFCTNGYIQDWNSKKNARILPK